MPTSFCLTTAEKASVAFSPPGANAKSRQPLAALTNRWPSSRACARQAPFPRMGGGWTLMHLAGSLSVFPECFRSEPLFGIRSALRLSGQSIPRGFTHHIFPRNSAESKATFCRSESFVSLSRVAFLKRKDRMEDGDQEARAFGWLLRGIKMSELCRESQQASTIFLLQAHSEPLPLSRGTPLSLGL